ncbi:hypothetical protein PSACC_02064 [Paramicrosporidium saccamoebae]|uniref:Uncharacterized protein n=1 Tax=Paramicrosporidium saccamoebae TaxID=1246581 RepID=A0A2H9TK41_9FUNG|nr:hypothetical protein PSACC_02064 [Paramicrosporidium saccamoebae]
MFVAASHLELVATGKYAAIPKTPSCLLAILEAIPHGEPPELYKHLLPDPHVYQCWYRRRACQLASTGHTTNAIKLLELSISGSKPSGLETQLLDTLYDYERVVSLLRMADREEVLQQFTFELFSRDRLEGLFKLLDGKMLQQFKQELLSSTLTILPNEISLLSNFTGDVTVLGESLSSEPFSVREQIASLRHDPKKHKRIIQRVMELLVKRRKAGTIDVSTWIQIQNYKELAELDELPGLEEFCFKELEEYP